VVKLRSPKSSSMDGIASLLAPFGGLVATRQGLRP